MWPEQRRLLLSFAIFLLIAPASHAETTPWADNEGGRMRIVALPPGADGAVSAVLEIEPKPGWITYWREPGGSGIPPQISVSGGASLREVSYPVPKILKLGELTDIGYDTPVSLPLKLANARDGAKVDVFIGLCNKICIPFQAGFDLKAAQGQPDPSEEAAISAAMKTLPEAPAHDFAVNRAHLEGQAMVLDMTVPEGTGDADIIITGPQGYVFTARAEKSASGKRQVSIPLEGLPASTGTATIRWQVLIDIGIRAMETEIHPE